MSGFVLIGCAKLVFGLLTSTLGVWIASRLLARLLGMPSVEQEIQKGNVAVAIIEVAAILSLVVLVRHGIETTFQTMDMLYRGSQIHLKMVGDFTMYALVHVGLALLLGAVVMALGVWIYGFLTRRVDEIAEIKKGNVAPALVVGAVMLAMAVLSSPGLEMVLTGLIPFPVSQDLEHGSR